MVGVRETSVDDFPRVGVRGGTSSGLEVAARVEGGGAASEGRMGVEVWRSTCDGRGREVSEVVQGLVRMSGRSGEGSDVSFMTGVEGREESSW